MTKQRKNAKKIAGTIFAAIATLIVGFFIYDYVVNYLDKQKFMTLKQDILTLQKEFNAIDQGWEYKEWCTSKGGEFEQNVASSCWVNLSNKKISNHQEYINSSLFKERLKIVNNQDANTDQGYKHANYTHFGGVKCKITYPEAILKEASTFSIMCNDTARDFYYP